MDQADPGVGRAGGSAEPHGSDRATAEGEAPGGTVEPTADAAVAPWVLGLRAPDQAPNGANSTTVTLISEPLGAV